MSITVVSIIGTKVFSSEKSQFVIYLQSEGFDNFDLLAPEGSVYLSIQFYNKGDIVRYHLRGIEHKYILKRSDAYFYDLDQSWDNEARDFFGDE